MKNNLLNKLLSLTLLIMGGAFLNPAWAKYDIYTFNSKSWGDTSNSWISGKDGNKFTSGRGVQVTSGASGANATTENIFSNVSEVVVTYSTNATSGAGDISIQIGSNSALTNTITSTGGTTDRTLTYTFSPNQTGAVKIAVACTTNSIYVKSVKITYTNTPTYNITAQSNDDSYGTVSLSGSVITGSPNTGYRYASPAYTISPANSATVVQDGDNFTVTPTEDTSVTINFEAIPKHTAHFSVNGTIDNNDDKIVAEGADINFPNDPNDINGKTFVGWVANAIVGTTDSEPSLVTSATMSTSDVTFYAVFATAAGSGSDSWTETDLASMTASDIFVFSNGSYALNNDGESANSPSANSITVSGEIITSTVADNLKWNVSGNSTDGYTFYPNGTTETWLYCNTTAASSSNNNIRVGTGDRKLWVFDNDGYLVTNDNSTARYLSLYNNQDFRGYTSNSNAFVPKFYKFVAGTTYSAYCTTVSSLPVPTITFTDANDNCITELNVNSINTTVPISVSCTAGDVTLSYTSDDDKVAKYDENEEKVLVYAEGTTTITATFAGNGSYQGTSTTLTVNVERGTTTLAFPVTPETINIDAVATYAATGTPAVSGITYSSSNEDVVMVDDETGEIAALALGSATITASFAGNDNYKAAETSYTIRVVDPNQHEYTLTNAQIVSAGEGVTGYAAHEITDNNGKKWNAYAIKNQHSNATSSNHFLQIRSYDKSTATAYYIQVPAYGTRIAGLEITVSSSSAPMNGTGYTGSLFFSASNSTAATGSGVASASVNSANTVTIDCSALNLNTGYITANASVRIWAVKVTYEYKVAVGSALYTTHVTKDAVDFEGVNAYIATKVNSETIGLTKVASAPANTPVIIEADAAKTYSLNFASSPADVSSNILLASDGSVEGNGSSIYALGLGKTGANEGKVGFYLVGENVVIPEGKAYLNLGGSPAKEFLTFDFSETPDGIKTLSQTPVKEEGIYNLSGQRLNKMQKGINIVNGKKVLY